MDQAAVVEQRLLAGERHPALGVQAQVLAVAPDGLRRVDVRLGTGAHRHVAAVPVHGPAGHLGWKFMSCSHVKS